MKSTGKITISMKPVHEILKNKGLTVGGDVQRFHTNNVRNRILKYMPFRSGATIKLTIAQTDISKPLIVIDVPHGKYVYYGVVMIGRAPKKATNIPLTYTKGKNPLAGPFWDRRLVAAEQAIMQKDLQDYVNRKRGRK